MTAAYDLSVAGEPITSVRLTVSNAGPWVADVDFEGDPNVSGRVEIVIGPGLKLSGTVVARSSGTYGLKRRARIVAGAGGWSAEVAPKAYHNDGGVKGRLVAEDAARAVGETIGDFVPAAERIGRDYARSHGPASCALEDVLGGLPWWVDRDGITHAGPRPPVPLDAKAYTVLAFDPRDRIATLAMDDPGAMKIGALLDVDGPQIVRSFEVRVTEGELRVMAWCAGSASGSGYLAGLIRSIVERTTDGAMHGHYRYRVVRMAGERVELQAVRKLAGLPDLLPISIMPGVPGMRADLAPGTEMLVAFVEGDRAQPVALAFSGEDGPGFVPVALTLGGNTGPLAARQGDAVEVLLPPAVISGTAMLPAGPTPITGVLTFTGQKAVGVITGASAKVKIA